MKTCVTPIAGVACAIDTPFPPTAEARKIEAIPIPVTINARMLSAITVRKVLVALSRMAVSPFVLATLAIKARGPDELDARDDALCSTGGPHDSFSIV